MGDISGIQERIGNLQTGRLGAIQSLADQLYQRDLAERKFQMEQQQAAAEAAAARSGGGGTKLSTLEATNYMREMLAPHRGKKDKFVSPAIWNSALSQWVQQGQSAAKFRQIFSEYRPSEKARQKNYG